MKLRTWKRTEKRKLAKQISKALKEGKFGEVKGVFNPAEKLQETIKEALRRKKYKVVKCFPKE